MQLHKIVCPDRSRSAAIRHHPGSGRDLRVGWDLVKEIHKTWLAAQYRAVNLSEVRYLGIDEFSLKKRHTYMTIFVDLQSGRILHAVEGTSKEAISPFLQTVA